VVIIDFGQLWCSKEGGKLIEILGTSATADGKWTVAPPDSDDLTDLTADELVSGYDLIEEGPLPGNASGPSR
jgi:hypothetical protein